MTTHPWRLAFCLLLSSLLLACGQKRAEPANNQAPAATQAQPNRLNRAKTPVAAPPSIDKAKEPAPETAQTGVDKAQLSSKAIESNPALEAGHKFIRTASAKMRVKDVYVAALAIEDAVLSHGGFVVKNRIHSETVHTEQFSTQPGKATQLREYRVEGELIVRVPSQRTQEFLRAIVSHIEFLDERTFAAHDAQFDYLREMLDYQRSNQTQSELGQLVQEKAKLPQKADVIASRDSAKLERDSALIRKMEFDDKIALSTIDLSLYQANRVAQNEVVDNAALFEKFKPGFFSRLSIGLVEGWSGLLEFVVLCSQLWPWLLIGLLAFVLWRKRRSNHSK